MREIKFRAWDKDKNIIRVVNELDFLTESIVTKPIDGTSEMWELYDHVCFKGSYELMQYTGLKDKNGVEIYEGDILDGEYGLSVVKYKDGVFILEYSFNVVGKKEKMQIALKYGCKNREVIGNIYENKELLEEK